MPESIIDRATLEALASTTDREFVGELVDTFLDDAPHLLESLQTSLSSQDAEAFRRAAHSLKSNGASLGAMAFSEAAKELELLGKEGNLAGAPPKVKDLQIQFDQVAAALREYVHES
jgi:HPt (histidine-containing phosphotransfer) domain-containing protein